MRKGITLAVAAIVVAGTAIRLAGAGFGLPAVYNPDEVAIMNRAMALAPNSFNPGNFLYPSFYFYALFAWEGLLFVTGLVAGRFASLAAFEREFFTDPSIHFLAGRVLSALCGAATIVLTWRLGRRLFGTTAGLVAAALIAVAPLAVRDAHYVKHDVPVTLLIVLTHLALARFVTRPPAAPEGARGLQTPGRPPAGTEVPALLQSPPALLQSRPEFALGFAAALAGLAFSTHYYAVFVFVPLVVVCLLPRAGGEPIALRLTRTMRALVVAGIAFLAASPFLILELDTVWRDVVANREIVVDRATTSGGVFASIGYYLAWLAGEASGSLAALLALGGLVVALRSGRSRAILTLAFPVTFLLFMANTVPASRYLNPVLPFMAVLGGAAIGTLVARGGRVRLVGGAIAIAAVAQAGAASLHTVTFFARTDTRTLAASWIESSVAPGSTVLVQPYSVPIRQSREGLREALVEHLGSPGRASIRFQRQLALDPYPEPAYRTIFLGTGGLDVDKIYIDPADVDRAGGLDPLRRLDVTHVVLKQYNVRDPAIVALEGALEREGRLAATFSPYRTDASLEARQRVEPFLHNTDARVDPALDRPGPIVEIWTIE